jgi:hypothetical protein
MHGDNNDAFEIGGVLQVLVKRHQHVRMGNVSARTCCAFAKPNGVD